MTKLLTAALEALFLLLFATGAMAALFDPASATLEGQGLAITGLLLLGLTRALANRLSLKRSRIVRSRS